MSEEKHNVELDKDVEQKEKVEQGIVEDGKVESKTPDEESSKPFLMVLLALCVILVLVLFCSMLFKQAFDNSVGSSVTSGQTTASATCEATSANTTAVVSNGRMQPIQRLYTTSNGVRVYYDVKTNVVYATVTSSDVSGYGLVMLLNADGTPRVYDAAVDGAEVLRVHSDMNLADALNAIVDPSSNMPTIVEDCQTGVQYWIKNSEMLPLYNADGTLYTAGTEEASTTE